MTWIEVFDILLAIGLLLSARQALFARDLFQAVAFFISFGLLMALAWVRLGAPDVALAEAAIGAGLTGALLFDAISQLARTSSPTARPPGPKMRYAARITASLVSIAMILAFWDFRFALPGLFPEMRDQLINSGTIHPMTAVLLNFRAWDTWLELGVLFLASLSILIIHRTNDVGVLPTLSTEPNPILRWLARTMLPLLIIIGGYLLWAGARSPGGAFQTGALIGAAGVLMQLGGMNPLARASRVLTRFGLILGFSTFSVIAVMVFLIEGHLLEYPISWAGTLILLIEVAAATSIALTLIVMYSGSRPNDEGNLT